MTNQQLCKCLDLELTNDVIYRCKACGFLHGFGGTVGQELKRQRNYQLLQAAASIRCWTLWGDNPSTEMKLQRSVDEAVALLTEIESRVK